MSLLETVRNAHDTTVNGQRARAQLDLPTNVATPRLVIYAKELRLSLFIAAGGTLFAANPS